MLSSTLQPFNFTTFQQKKANESGGLKGSPQRKLILQVLIKLSHSNNVYKVMETYENIFEEKPIIVPTKEHTFLEDFVGKWVVEGKNFDVASNEAAIEVKGIETYEWLAGGFFLVYKWERYIGTTNHQGLGIISHDDSNHIFELNNYDNMGYNRAYKIVHEANSWKFSGPTERAIVTFSADGNRFTENWEIYTQENWKPLCQLSAKRINS